MAYKLTFELVPDGCWYSNLRSILSKKEWDLIKAIVKQKSNGKCSICGKNTSRIEAHERWQYDKDKGIQKLVDIIGVCRDCHSVIHIGRTQLLGNEQRAEEHFMRVNNCSYADYRQELSKANITHQELNKVNEWAMDISFLKKFILLETNEEQNGNN